MSTASSAIPSAAANAAAPAAEARESALGSRDFERISALLHARTGIVLSAAKRQMVTTRLQKRLRAHGLASWSDYVALVEDAHSEESEHFVNALTTNLTSFFREGHHFEHLAGDWFQEQQARRRSSGNSTGNSTGKKELRIWSAGCSTGEEPWSIAMSLLEVLPGDWTLRVLATDLDSQVVETARAGVYREERVAELSPARLRRFFRRGTGRNAGLVSVAPELRERVTFRTLNLLDPWPMRGRFDAIFCRNVVIYFSKATQGPLFERYADILEDDGHLYIGHSETLYRLTDRFKPLGGTIYRKQSSARP